MTPWRRHFSPDTTALAALAALMALVTGNRLVFDTWLARLDIFTQFLPWYDYLGERSRAFTVPGWNPHLFSGAPFAGDPLSGWAYLPAMLAFALLPAIAAFKAMVAAQLTIAGLSTYAFARSLGLRPAAALVAAAAYVCGPFLQWNTYCCLQFAQFATWIPLALLGVELALQAERWRDRVVPWCATGVALSQMFGGWVGEGWFYAVFLIATYAGYRTVFGAAQFGRGLKERLPAGGVTALVAIGLGAVLGAAGILPRLAVNAETTLAGGDYARLGQEGALNPPWRPSELPVRLLAEGYDHRATALGGAVAVLVLVAPAIAGRLFATPYFAALTIVALVLPLEATPVHRLAYLVPRYQALHEHDPWRAVALAAIGPAVLAGAAVNLLPAWRGRWRRLPLVVAPLAAMLIVTRREAEGAIGGAPLLTAVAATALLVLALIAPRGSDPGGAGPEIARLLPILLLVLVVVQPVGLEATGSWLGWPRDPSWERHWRPDPVVARTLAAEMQTEDPGGAGEFLRNRLGAAGPFRYVGYGGTGNPDDPQRRASYLSRRFEPVVQALLVNGRAIVLGLNEVQGYNPTQLARYAEFVAAVNGRQQNYHVAYLFPSGTGSPLLDLLDLRYVVLDASLPRDREDVARLTAGKAEVFSTDLVAVYEAERPPPHAWVVYDIQAVAHGEALPRLVSGAVDPYRTALIEGAVPEGAVPEGAVPDVAAPASEAGGLARVTRYEPEAITIEVTATAPGLLVVSEVYAAGWLAYIDGAPAPILPTHHALRGVPLPVGAHTVDMRYEPPALRLGLLVSAVSWAGLLLAMLAIGLRPRVHSWRRRHVAGV